MRRGNITEIRAYIVSLAVLLFYLSEGMENCKMSEKNQRILRVDDKWQACHVKNQRCLAIVLVLGNFKCLGVLLI